MIRGWRLVAFVIVCTLASRLAWGQSTQATPATQPASVAVVVLKGEVDDLQRDALYRHFAEARAAGAKTVILQINTYGGLVTAGLDISGFLKRQTDLHTVAFVDEKAISAGAMIAMACDEIVMDPSAVIGDCAPIVFKTDGTLDTMGAAERAKAESPVLADFLDSAQRNHHDPMLAAAMVSINHGLRAWQDPAGGVHFTSLKADAKPQPDWKPLPDVPDPLNADDTLLTVHTDVAKRIGLATGVAASPAALAETRGEQITARFEDGWGEQFVELLSNPLARGVLILIFMGSLKICLSAPGHGAAEAIAMVSLALLLGMPLLTGYATWWEVALIFVGLGLIAFEVFVFPGHFVSAVTGMLMVLVGLIFTFVGAEPAGHGFWPQMPQTYESMERGLVLVTVALGASLGLWIWLGKFLPSIPYFSRLILTETSGGSRMISREVPPPPEPAWPPVGSIGVAVTELKPGGSARFSDGVSGDTRMVAVVNEEGFVAPGTKLVVRETRANRVLVRPLKDA